MHAMVCHATVARLGRERVDRVVEEGEGSHHQHLLGRLLIGRAHGVVGGKDVLLLRDQI